MDNLIGLADDITVSGKLLQNKYSGTIIWHSRDPKTFRPRGNSRLNTQIKKVIDTKKTSFKVGFIGTPRPHKGIEDLIHAFKILNNKDIVAVIAGADDDWYSRSIRSLVSDLGLNENFIIVPKFEFKLLPDLLTMIDIVVIPQKKTTASHMQVPAKLFDAMAMAKPIVGTNVSEIGAIINGCGLVVEPGKPEELSKAIDTLYAKPRIAKKLGLTARKVFLEKYSWDLNQERLVSIFYRYE